MSLHSAIYCGSVRHRRFMPVVHAFRYRVFMLYLDLAELPAVFDGTPLWSARRPALAWFRRRDYLGDPEQPLDASVRQAVAELRGDPPDGPIRMLTNLRYFGYCINPVTHYYCFGRDGKTLDCVLVEVTNTPWGERHRYLIPGAERLMRHEFDKVFHVSPFHPLQMRYRWRGNVPGEHLAVHMENVQDDRSVTDATLRLERRALNSTALLSLLLRYPWMTASVALGIYWQALRLWLKGAPIFDHPGSSPGARVTEVPMERTSEQLATLERPLQPASGVSDRWVRQLVMRQLSRLARGRLLVDEGGQRHVFGNTDAAEELVAHLVVHDVSAYRDVLLRGTVGAGEAFMRGSWSSPDLTGVIRIFVANLELMDDLDGRMLSPRRLIMAATHLALRAWHGLRANTRRGARDNIAAHYDLGNDFFRLFLDPTMMYSSAVFPSEQSSLEDASLYKLDLICQKLQLSPGDHLLEIGTGWGGLALHAAQRYGCRVTTTTISREQHDFAMQRVREAGLEDRVTVLLQDYRDLEGRFDKLVSVEMIEAVGHRYYSAYFRQFSRLLKPEGLALVQAITIADQRYDSARRSVDFIQRYIFPGGSLPSTSVIAGHLARDTDLTIVGIEDITLHYARTLAAWRERFMARLDQVREQGFDEVFIRMWHFYLSYCEGGFLERSIGTQQILMARPGWRPGQG